jgi:hypothetical protein
MLCSFAPRTDCVETMRFAFLLGYEMTPDERTLDNYEGAFLAADARAREAAVERAKTGAITPRACLAIAGAALSFALAWKLAGKSRWSNFIALWMPACLVAGICNSKRKLRDRSEVRRHRGYAT